MHDRNEWRMHFDQINNYSSNVKAYNNKIRLRLENVSETVDKKL